MAFMAATCSAAGVIHSDSQSGLRFVDEGMSFPLSLGTAQHRGESDIFIISDDLDPRRIYATRQTTEQEHSIAILRSWKDHGKDWDGEGAKSPNISSISAAANFVCLLDRDDLMPEPMLNDTGRAGLFWESDGLYADLEFSENGSIAYFIQHESQRYKGSVVFDGKKIPAELAFFLKA